MALFIILNEEVDDITNIVKSLEEWGLLVKVVTIKNEAKEQKGISSYVIRYISYHFIANFIVKYTK